ncbi:Elongation of very long chain fatty acids protein 4, partial [Geodia barretti]
MDLLSSYWEGAKARYETAMNNGDPRVADWFLMDSPFPTLALCLAYLGMCYAGPRMMANREPFQLRPVIIVYNLVMVLVSAYMCYEILITTYHLKFNYWCDLVVYSPEHYAMRLASVIWVFYFTKIVEFLDTFFFILRKKNNQISVLHIYHHSTMAALWWIGVKWFAGGASFFSAMVNSFVHTIMYSYYLLSALGPSVRPYLWWKKYLTMLQLAQFAVILLHVVQAVYNGCRYDVRPQWTLVVYMLSHIALFGNFYKHTYSKKPPRDSHT